MPVGVFNIADDWRTGLCYQCRFIISLNIPQMGPAANLNPKRNVDDGRHPLCFEPRQNRFPIREIDAESWCYNQGNWLSLFEIIKEPFCVVLIVTRIIWASSQTSTASNAFLRVNEYSQFFIDDRDDIRLLHRANAGVGTALTFVSIR